MKSALLAMLLCATPLHALQWKQRGVPMEAFRNGIAEARGYEDDRRWQDAIRTYEVLLSMAHTYHDRWAEGIALHNIGAVYREMRDFERAIDYAMRSLPRLREAGSLDELQWALWETITVLRALHRIDDTRPLLDQIIGIALTQKNEKEEWKARKQLCGAFQQVAKYNQAFECYGQLIGRARKRSNVAVEIEALSEAGWIQAKRNRPDDAKRAYESAFKLAREAKSDFWMGRLLADLSGLLVAEDKYDEALAMLEEASSHAKAADDRAGLSVIHDSRGIAYRRVGDLDAALRAYGEALAAVPESENPHDAANILYNMAVLHQSVGDDENAVGYFNRAAALRTRLTDRAGEATLLAGRAVSQMRLGATKEAEESFHQAREVMRAVGSRRGEAAILDNMAELYVRDDPAKALALRTEALAAARDAKDRGAEAATLLNIGTIHFGRGEMQKAGTAFQQAIGISHDIGDASLEATAIANRGAVLEVGGKPEQAIEHYERALGIRERERARTTVPAIRTLVGELSSTPSLYAHVASLYLRRGEAERAFRTTERARARVFLDQLASANRGPRRGIDAKLAARELKARREVASLDRALREEIAKPELLQNERVQELESGLQTAQRTYDEVLTAVALADPEYTRLSTARTSTLAEIQRELGSDTTLISYFFAESGAVAFVISGSSFKAVQLNATHEQIAEKVAAFRSFRSPDDAPPLLQSLYTALYAPIENDVQTHSVAIVPHGTLNDLPFAALMKNGELALLDDRAISALPSASALVLLRQRPAERRGATLAMAFADAAGFPHLQHAQAEARAVATKLGTKALVGKEATEKSLREKASQLSVVHIAAHGQLNADVPSLSRMMLAPDANDDGALTATEVFDLDLRNVSLAVLSGCRTQLGTRTAGDDAVALNRSFFYAGVRSVVASLWSVDDESTAALMTVFYAALEKGMSKAAALQKAQIETRKRYAHPFHWAPFVISGDAARPIVR